MKNKRRFSELYCKEIPHGSILGINYSGMHDSSIALIDSDGKPLFCCSLERITRVKQDGRNPLAFIHDIPWERIEAVALSVDEDGDSSADLNPSAVHPWRLMKQLSHGIRHGKPFDQFLQTIPVPVRYVPHHMSHAASSFWASGFQEALCLVYDGGMLNEHYFGGVYVGTQQEGLISLDTFHAYLYANITRIYTAVTALLGFSPLKHEGKITGLAALGNSSSECKSLLHSWLEDPEALNGLLKWIDIYGEDEIPQLIVSPEKAAFWREECRQFSDETLAASVQELAEEHIIDILKNVIANGWEYENICLSGGLFANVKINQRIAQLGYKNLFVAPAMSDDGTALGAAWHVLFQTQGTIKYEKLTDIYLGPRAEINEAKKILKAKNIQYIKTAMPAKYVAKRLAEGYAVALFQNECEFGPRALGNRSIIAPANDPLINKKLNDRLHRTEFMPFAPVVRIDDAELCFKDIKNVKRACEFMTVTVDCTPRLSQDSPAVVHCDNTARPQIVHNEINPLLYEILTEYRSITGQLCLVNTSFNVHEEPIVCSVEDALKGFFESGLDCLYIGDVGLIDLQENQSVEKLYLKQKISVLANNQKNLKKQLMDYAFNCIRVMPNMLYDTESLVCSTMKGFHPKEGWGVWSSGKKGVLRIKLKEKHSNLVQVRIKFGMKIFEPLLKEAPIVKMMFGKDQVVYAMFREKMRYIEAVELNVLCNDQYTEIFFECTNEDSPLNHGSMDGRILSFGIENFSAEIIEEKQAALASPDVLFIGAN